MNTIIASEKILQGTMQYEGETILTYRIGYPFFQGTQYEMSLEILNRLYETRAKEYLRQVEEELYAQAVEVARYNKENGYPIMVFEAYVTFTVTYGEDCILSLYFDQYVYAGGAHGSTVRSSQTWNLQRCRKIRLRELFLTGFPYRAYLFAKIQEQIGEEPEYYFENYHSLLRETFNENSFYVTPDGLVIYYQQYDIAPYSSGIRTFLIPYSDAVQNPKNICFLFR